MLFTSRKKTVFHSRSTRRTAEVIVLVSSVLLTFLSSSFDNGSPSLPPAFAKQNGVQGLGVVNSRSTNNLSYTLSANGTAIPIKGNVLPSTLITNRRSVSLMLQISSSKSSNETAISFDILNGNVTVGGSNEMQIHSGNAIYFTRSFKMVVNAPIVENSLNRSSSSESQMPMRLILNGLVPSSEQANARLPIAASDPPLPLDFSPPTSLLAPDYFVNLQGKITIGPSNVGGVSGNRNGTSYKVDPSVKPSQPSLPDEGVGIRPLAALNDSKGIVTNFVANDVVFTPKGSSDLNSFLQRYHGIVIHNGSIPAIPGQKMRPLRWQPPSSYTIRLDPSGFNLENISADSAKIGITGTIRVSSDSAQRLLALVAHERAAGEDVRIDTVGRNSGGILLRTSDGMNGKSNSMEWHQFKYAANIIGHQDSWIDVFKAWQFVNEYGVSYQPRVAIIDSGFWLDDQGHPKMGNDFPFNPIQHNFIDSSNFAGGGNALHCGGLNNDIDPNTNADCKGHGNHAAEEAVAAVNNGWGSAGTGGLVSVPMFLKAETAEEHDQAIVYAAENGADIISMSYFLQCDSNCIAFGGDQHMNADITNAIKYNNVLVIASSGNDGAIAWQENIFPCIGGGLQLCVGALDPTNEEQPVSYSNVGDGVNIYAPTSLNMLNIDLNGNSDGSICFGCYTGTSASAPYVAGIAAMIKAINPNLSGNDIANIITSTTGGVACVDWQLGASGCPPRIDAYAAVVNAVGGYHLAPVVFITSPKDGSQITEGPGLQSSPVGLTAWAYDIQDSGVVGNLPLGCQLGSPHAQYGCSTKPGSYNWKSSVDGSESGPNSPFSQDQIYPDDVSPQLPATMPPGSSFTPQDQTSLNLDEHSTPGNRIITVTATNSAGVSSSASISINVKINKVPPQPVFSLPQNGADISVGIPVTIEAYAPEPGYLNGWVDCSKMNFVINGPGSFTTTLQSTPDSTYQGTGKCDAQTIFGVQGTATITARATSEQGAVGTSSINVNVLPQTSKFDFTMTSPSPNILGCSGSGPGENCATVHTTFSLQLLSGGPQTVSLSLQGDSLPSGASYSFSPSSLSLSPSTPTASVTLTIQPGSVTSTTKNLTIVATGGGVTKTQNLTFNYQIIQ